MYTVISDILLSWLLCGAAAQVLDGIVSVLIYRKYSKRPIRDRFIMIFLGPVALATFVLNFIFIIFPNKIWPKISKFLDKEI